MRGHVRRQTGIGTAGAGRQKESDAICGILLRPGQRGSASSSPAGD